MKRTVFFLSFAVLILLTACNVPLVPVEMPVSGIEATATVVIPTATLPPAVTATQPPAPTSTSAPVVIQPTAPQPSTDFSDLNAVGSELARAIEARDFAALRALMPARFSISTFNQSLYEYTSEEALNMLSQSSLAPGSAPAVRFGTDVVALLSGADPLDQWGPVAQVVRAVHVMGLGPNGTDEAVLVIGRDPSTKRFYWHGILLPQADGYFKPVPMPDPLEVVETDVKYVMAKEDINVRSGPGMDYAVIGQIWGGQIAEVHGRSVSGAWYRIYCTQDISGYCWITADPALTEPTTAP